MHATQKVQVSKTLISTAKRYDTLCYSFEIQTNRNK